MQGNNHIGVYLKLHKVKDSSIIKRLSEVGNKQGYIKDLITKDMKEVNEHDTDEVFKQRCI